MNGKWNDYSFCSVTHDEVKRGFFLLFLFYSILFSLSLSLYDARPLLSFSGDTPALACSREKQLTIFFKENFRDS